MFVPRCQIVLQICLLLLLFVANHESRARALVWNPSDCPTHCVCKAEGSLRKVYCDIVDRKIRLTTIPSKFPDDTECITLSGNRIATIPAGAFARLSQLRYLSLSRNELVNLPNNVFHGLTKLISLDITHNRLSSLSPGLLSGLTSLQDLHLGNNFLQQLPPNFFTGLTSLRKLFLNNNQLYTFSEQLFGSPGEIKHVGSIPTKMKPKAATSAHPSSHETLSPNQSGIHQVQDSSFKRILFLRKLKLNNNNISTLSRGLFSKLKSLEFLSIYNNPFQCTCSLKWLKYWILYNDKSIKIFHRDMIKCHGPASVRGEVLVDVTDRKFSCRRKQYTSWSSWSPCSKSCGEGMKSRTRNCSQDTTPCRENIRHWHSCNLQDCKEEWSEWSTWSPCNATCSDGQQTRSRERCRQSPCEKQVEIRVCMYGPCPQYSQWSSWSSCDKICGEGKRHRNRTCGDGKTMKCPGPSEESKPCFLQNCAQWSSWSIWTACSKTCSDGIQHRTRECIIVGTSQEQCNGNKTEQQLCNVSECPVDGGWSIWSPWSECSKSCGFGYSVSYRNCSNPMPQHGGKVCVGRNHNITVCTLGICSEDSGYTAWSSWSQCSSLCGTGHQKRTRNCTQIDRISKVPMCLGGLVAYRECESYQQCDLTGVWAEWSPWGNCNGNCKEGQKIRWRFCEKTPGKIPPYNGRYLCGNNQTFDHEEVRCKPTSCNHHPKWSTWSYWSQCSRTCGRGTRRRQRFCLTNVIGQKCRGDYESKEPCNTHGCPIHGGWGAWGHWGECSEQCNGGLKNRSRACNQPPPANNGNECIGDRNERTICNAHRCRNHVVGDAVMLQPRAKCPDMAKPKNGKVVKREQRDGNTFIEYKCNKYFRNRGVSRIRICGKDGEWSGENADCVPECGETNSRHSSVQERLDMYGHVMYMNQSWPWQVAVKVPDKDAKCGGSLYGDKWIITAAHCVLVPKSRILVENITVQLGSNIWQKEYEKRVQEIPVEKVYVHEHFEWDIYRSDIALLKLKKNVVITSTVRPVCLPVSKRHKQLLVKGKVGVMVGWGSPQKFLRQMSLPVVNWHVCSKAYGRRGWKVTNKMLCAGAKIKNRDTCGGDSGGGFLFPYMNSKGKVKWILGGIVSWGNPSCTGRYTVFTNVAKHVDWIKGKVKTD